MAVMIILNVGLTRRTIVGLASARKKKITNNKL